MKPIRIKILLLVLAVFTINLYAYDTLSTRQIYPGCFYYQIADTTWPVVIHMVKVDITNPKLKVSVGVAHDSLNLGGERTSDFVIRKAVDGKKVIAAVNADFFGDSPMQAQNSIISDGKIIKATNLSRSQIAFENYNQPKIGSFKFSGDLISDDDTIKIAAINSQDSTITNKLFTYDWTGLIPYYADRQYLLFEYDGSLEPDVSEHLRFIKSIDQSDSVDLSKKQIILQVAKRAGNAFIYSDFAGNFSFKGLSKDCTTMTAGLPGLFTGGEVPTSFVGKEGMKSERFLGKNPRTAIGYNKDKSELILVAADGRRADYSMGMTLLELAEFMSSMGCYDALNFDGGGSTTMVVKDELVNSPSDFSGERAVYNMLVIYAEE